MRLDRAVALAGLTRAQARKAVAAGRVTVDGRKATDAGMAVEPGSVALDGAPIEAPGEVHVMVNKPAGVLTATEDRRFQTVLDLLPPALQRRGPGPVGRLDRDVTGLVLLTTDGQLAHRLISPKWKAEKVYVGRCAGRLTPADAERFAEGVAMSDFTARPAAMNILEAGDAESVAEVVLTEGKFHQVKRMFAAVGHPLIALERRRIGPVALDAALPVGGWRLLDGGEIAALYEAVGLEIKS